MNIATPNNAWEEIILTNCFHVCTSMQSISEAEQRTRRSFELLSWCQQIACTHLSEQTYQRILTRH